MQNVSLLDLRRIAMYLHDDELFSFCFVNKAVLEAADSHHVWAPIAREAAALVLLPHVPDPGDPEQQQQQQPRGRHWARRWGIEEQPMTRAERRNEYNNYIDATNAHNPYIINGQRDARRCFRRNLNRYAACQYYIEAFAEHIAGPLLWCPEFRKYLAYRLVLRAEHVLGVASLLHRIANGTVLDIQAGLSASFVAVPRRLEQRNAHNERGGYRRRWNNNNDNDDSTDSDPDYVASSAIAANSGEQQQQQQREQRITPLEAQRRRDKIIFEHLRTQDEAFLKERHGSTAATSSQTTAPPLVLDDEPFLPFAKRVFTILYCTYGVDVLDRLIQTTNWHGLELVRWETRQELYSIAEGKNVPNANDLNELFEYQRQYNIDNGIAPRSRAGRLARRNNIENSMQEFNRTVKNPWLAKPYRELAIFVRDIHDALQFGAGPFAAVSPRMFLLFVSIGIIALIFSVVFVIECFAFFVLPWLRHFNSVAILPAIDYAANTTVGEHAGKLRDIAVASVSLALGHGVSAAGTALSAVWHLVLDSLGLAGGVLSGLFVGGTDSFYKLVAHLMSVVSVDTSPEGIAEALRILQGLSSRDTDEKQQQTTEAPPRHHSSTYLGVVVDAAWYNVTSTIETVKGWFSEPLAPDFPRCWEETSTRQMLVWPGAIASSAEPGSFVPANSTVAALPDFLDNATANAAAATLANLTNINISSSNSSNSSGGVEIAVTSMMCTNPRSESFAPIVLTLGGVVAAWALLSWLTRPRVTVRESTVEYFASLDEQLLERHQNRIQQDANAENNAEQPQKQALQQQQISENVSNRNSSSNKRKSLSPLAKMSLLCSFSGVLYEVISVTSLALAEAFASFSADHHKMPAAFWMAPYEHFPNSRVHFLTDALWGLAGEGAWPVDSQVAQQGQWHRFGILGSFVFEMVFVTISALALPTFQIVEHWESYCCPAYFAQEARSHYFFRESSSTESTSDDDDDAAVARAAAARAASAATPAPWRLSPAWFKLKYDEFVDSNFGMSAAGVCRAIWHRRGVFAHSILSAVAWCTFLFAVRWRLYRLGYGFITAMLLTALIRVLGAVAGFAWVWNLGY